jgi:hypothetical protein
VPTTTTSLSPSTPIQTPISLIISNQSSATNGSGGSSSAAADSGSQALNQSQLQYGLTGSQWIIIVACLAAFIFLLILLIIILACCLCITRKRYIVQKDENAHFHSESGTVDSVDGVSTVSSQFARPIHPARMRDEVEKM